MSVTGYQATMYRDITELRKAARRMADALELLALDQAFRTTRDESPPGETEYTGRIDEAREQALQRVLAANGVNRP